MKNSISKKLTLWLLIFSVIFTFSACELGEEEEDEKDSTSLKIKSVTPADEGTISQGDTVTAQLKYSIKNFDKNKTYAAVIWIKKTQGYGSYGYGLADITSSEGTVQHSYTVNNEFDSDAYLKPFKVKYSINIADNSTSFFSADYNWDTSLIVLSDEITLNVQ